MSENSVGPGERERERERGRASPSRVEVRRERLVREGGRERERGWREVSERVREREVHSDAQPKAVRGSTCRVRE